MLDVMVGEGDRVFWREELEGREVEGVRRRGEGRAEGEARCLD